MTKQPAKHSSSEEQGATSEPGESSHADESAFACDPGGHDTHTWRWAMGWKVFSGHSAQVLDAATGLNEQGEHGVQTDTPDGEYDPAEQFVIWVDPLTQ